MCKINMKMDLYYFDICKHEHEKKKKGYGARLWLRLVLNKLKEMRGFTFIYIPLRT
jgi:hypothetical protein